MQKIKRVSDGIFLPVGLGLSLLCGLLSKYPWAALIAGGTLCCWLGIRKTAEFEYKALAFLGTAGVCMMAAAGIISAKACWWALIPVLLLAAYLLLELGREVGEHERAVTICCFAAGVGLALGSGALLFTGGWGALVSTWRFITVLNSPFWKFGVQWGRYLFLLLFLFAVSLGWKGFAGTAWVLLLLAEWSPEGMAAAARALDKGPVVAIQRCLVWASNSLGGAGWGMLLLGAVLGTMLGLLLIKTTCFLSRLGRVGKWSEMKEGSGTELMKAWTEEGGSWGFLELFLRYVLLIEVPIIFTISAWMALGRLRAVAVSTRFKALGIPDIALPRWRPVWGWGYPVLAFVLLLLMGALVLIHWKSRSPQGGEKEPPAILSFLTVFFILCFPAGIVLSYISATLVLCAWPPLAAWRVRSYLESKPIVREPETPFAGVSLPESRPQREETHQPVEDDRFPILGGELLVRHPEELVDVLVIEEERSVILDKKGNLTWYREGVAERSLELGIEVPLGLKKCGEDRMLAVGGARDFGIVAIDGEPDVKTSRVLNTIQFFTVNTFGTMLAYCKRGRYGAPYLHNLIDLDPHEEQELDSVPGPRSMAFSIDGRFLAIGCLGYLRVVDMVKRNISFEWKPDLDEADRGGEVLVAAIPGNRWAVAMGGNLFAVAKDEGATRHPLGQEITALGAHPTHGTLAAGTKGGMLYVVSGGDDPWFSARVHEDTIVSVSFLENESEVVSASEGGAVRLVRIR